MRKNEPAPFDCQCLKPETALAITTAAEQCPAKTAAEVTKAVQLVRVDIDLLERKRQLEARAAEIRIKLLEQELEAKRVWYESPVLVAAISSLLTATLIMVARETVLDVR